MPIQAIDKETCRVLAERVTAALRPLADELGLEVRYRGGRYDDLQFTARVEFTVKADASGRSKYQVEFEQYCKLFGLEPEDYGKIFRSMRSEYRLAGIVPNRGKYPMIGERVPDGKRFKFRTVDVVRQLKGAEAAQRFAETDFERRAS